jgi:hypothetical protein
MSVFTIVFRKVISAVLFVVNIFKKLIGLFWRRKESNIGELPLHFTPTAVISQGHHEQHYQSYGGNAVNYPSQQPQQNSWNSWNDTTFGVESKIEEYRKKQAEALQRQKSKEKNTNEMDFFEDLRPEIKATKRVQMEPKERTTPIPRKNLFEFKENEVDVPVVYSEFDVLHTFLQRFAGAFHLGFALFEYLNLYDNLRVEPIVHFAKALTAGFLLFTKLFTAYNLSNPGVRGVRFNHSYLLPILFTDGIWTAVEIYRLIRSPRRLHDEIDLMSKRTQRFIEGRSNLDNEKLLLADSALSFIYAFSNFAFPNQILKLLIKNRVLLDGAHKLFSRQFGCYMLFSAIVSLLGTHFTVAHQESYVLQRILTQALIIALHAYGHFVLGIYDISHCTPFVIAILYMSLLSTIYFKIRRQENDGTAVDGNNGVNKRTVVTYQKTVEKDE